MELDRLVLGEARSVAKRLVDVVGFQVRIRLQDLSGRLLGRQEPEQPRHGEAEVPDARLARTDVGAGLGGRQREVEGRAAARRALDPDAASLGLGGQARMRQKH